MKNDKIRLLIADKNGKIFAHPDLEATGMKAGLFFRLEGRELIKLPQGSQLFKLPSRRPVGYDPWSGLFITTPDAFTVAAFAAPGRTITYNAAYSEDEKAEPLPLFSYGACAEYKGEIYTAAVVVDKDKRHDTTLMDKGTVAKNILKFKKLFPKNRLIKHLARCAKSYGCPNAQNFFLRKYEAPLPTAPLCNASCAGCISRQKGKIRCNQPRIEFVPSALEVSEIALFHIANVRDAIVSFGQGCEGEPLLQGKLIEEAIRIIRRCTNRGTINMNTNGSMPQVLSRLFDAGLDTVRISLNSAREEYYSRYYQPRGYTFSDVLNSIQIASKKARLVSLNYLTMPGFTDSRDEIKALESLLSKFRINMIQWRNLNYDPLLYFKILKLPEVKREDLVGIHEEMHSLKKRFPKLKMGYFNPRAAASRRR